MTSVRSGIRSNSGSIKNTTIALLVFALNAVVESEGFLQCPPDNFAFYASCFIILPALLLFMRTIFLHNGFWNFVCGFCFSEEQEKQEAKRFCCCFYPRWSCSRPLLEIIFQSSLSGFLWIFWTLLQHDYFICAVLGGRKEAKLINATTEEKLQIEADYANAGKNSQAAALLLLGGALTIAFVFLLVQRFREKSVLYQVPIPTKSSNRKRQLINLKKT